MSSVYLHALNRTRPLHWRVTPPGQPAVPDLVAPGASLRTSYGTGGIVVAVRGPYTQHWDLSHPPAWTILFVLPQHYRGHGKIPEHWWDNAKVMSVGDLVAVDRRLLKVCSDGSDEVFVDPLAQACALPSPTQLALAF
jgi:hypothetical protein